MKHSQAFVDPRGTRAFERALLAESIRCATETRVAVARPCPCGARGAHTLCPLQPLPEALRNAQLR